LLPNKLDQSSFLHPSFSNAPATTEISTLSLHDALPISPLTRPFPPSPEPVGVERPRRRRQGRGVEGRQQLGDRRHPRPRGDEAQDRKSTRLNSSHVKISYAVFCLKKKKRKYTDRI